MNLGRAPLWQWSANHQMKIDSLHTRSNEAPALRVARAATLDRGCWQWLLPTLPSDRESPARTCAGRRGSRGRYRTLPPPRR